jgi:hypothetical protein
LRLLLDLCTKAFHLYNFVNITAPFLYRLNCAIYETKLEQGFITCDNPCFWFDPAILNPKNPVTFFGVGSPTLNVIMPISPRQYISLEKDGPDGYINLNNKPEIEKESVDLFNTLIVTTQGSGATKLGRKGEPAKARRKAARALTPFLRAVER